MSFDVLTGKFSKGEAKLLNALVLAYIGDAIFEVLIRTYLIDNNRELSAHKLHKEAIKYVSAHSQSVFFRKIQNYLTEEEMSVYKRGRNSKSSAPKNADVQEYRVATGLEALIGYLYLEEKEERLNQIFSLIITKDEEEKNEG